MVTSGRQWEPIASVVLPGATNLGYWVADSSDESVRGWFKYVNPSKPLKSSMYSFGVEWAAVKLARYLDLPVPEVFLEDVRDRAGLVSLVVPGAAWESLADDTVRKLTFADRDQWTTYCAFDVLVANHDRHAGNIFVEWNPPARRLPVEGEQAALWLIDYGWSGLWPVYKFGAGLTQRDLEALPDDADLRPEFVHALRNNMPPRYRNNLAFRGTPEREQALANLRRITDDAIDAIVAEVPETYMTARAAEATAAFLRGRLARIDTLADTVFPT